MVKPKVFLLHSEISPYRLPLFEELSKKVDLQVCFCQSKSKKRLWDSSTNGYSFKRNVLKFINVGQLIVNYSLPFEITYSGYHVYIIDDDPRLTFSKLFVFLVAKLFRKPIVVWTGAIEEGYYDKMNQLINRHLLSPLRRVVYNYSNAFVPYSSKTMEFLIKNGVPKKKIRNGISQTIGKKDLNGEVDPSQQKRLKQKLGIKDKKIILFVGYLTGRKGVTELVEAFKQMNRNDAALVIAGAGKDLARLRKAVTGVKNIYFPGYVSGAKKATYYAAADIFVMPTFADPWGLVINEAMMFGLPIITTTAAGASELVQGNGVIIEPGNSKALTQALEYLLDNDEIRKEMGRKSREIIKEYTTERAVETFTKAIAYCLNGHSR